MHENALVCVQGLLRSRAVIINSGVYWANMRFGRFDGLKQIYPLLAIAIVLEVIGTTSMKLSMGFTHLIPSLIVVLGYGGALFLYIYIVRKAELGIIFALWSGLGTTLVALIGILLFNESVSVLKIVGLVFVIIGVFLLNHEMSGDKEINRGA
jgi:small multidrug resistance pump